MQIKISSKHVQVTEAIESYASKKIEKFPRYFDRVTQVEVVIDKAPQGYRVEIITESGGRSAVISRSRLSSASNSAIRRASASSRSASWPTSSS